MAHKHTYENECCEHCHSGHGHHEHGEHEHHEHSGHERHEHGGHGQLWTIVLGVVFIIAAIVIEKTFTELSTWQLLLVYLVPYLIVGHDTLREAVEGLVHGDALNEHFLMSVATVGALAIGFLPGAETEFPEAVFVMLFFQIGEMFEGYAEGQSRKSIAHLMDIRPDVAHVERDGIVTDVSPEEVAVGETIVIRPGEKVPLDGRVNEGASSIDTMALTGESIPRSIAVGDDIVSGCVNLSGVIRVTTTKSFGESTVAKIIDLVENAGDHKSRSETFITRFARVYTPIVVVAALIIAIVPPLLSLLTSQSSLLSPLSSLPSPLSSFLNEFPHWLHRALIFLIVSCPCALVISVPLTFFGGIGGASRSGILVKGSNYIDVLAKVGTVVFDKTGTLTEGHFSVTAVHHNGTHCACPSHDFSQESILHMAAHVEHHSTHPIGAALREAFPEEATDGCTVSNVEEVAGHGVKATVSDNTQERQVCVGNTKMMDAIGAKWIGCEDTSGTIIHVAIDGEYAGHIVAGDTVKEGSRAAIAQLKSLGVERTVMLTGDRREVAQEVANRLGIDEFHAELLPSEKVEYVERLSDGTKPLAFVGDGINDAPALARADVGIAMGGLGSDAAIEAADVVIMDDDPQKIATAIAIARRTLSIARQNVVLAIGVKVAVLALAAVGLGNMMMAVFADVGVTVIAVLNAMRALRR